MDIVSVVKDAISERKGENIVIYDVMPVSSVTDTMIVASASNLRQAQAIKDNILDRLAENGFTGSIRTEGRESSTWLLIDLGDVVVHIFTGSERKNYDLDRLYAEFEAERVPD